MKSLGLISGILNAWLTRTEIDVSNLISYIGRVSCSLSRIDKTRLYVLRLAKDAQGFVDTAHGDEKHAVLLGPRAP